MKHERSKKVGMKHYTLKLNEGENVKYTKEDLVDILSNISFELININLSSKKSYLGINATGYNAVGFVNGFNPEEETFNVVVFENRTEAIDSLGEIVVIPRVFTNRDGEITKVIGLDVEPVNA